MMPRWASSSIWLEHRTHNPQVEGSNPSRPTIYATFFLALIAAATSFLVWRR
jgi:hypothetical protein